MVKLGGLLSDLVLIVSNVCSELLVAIAQAGDFVECARDGTEL